MTKRNSIKYYGSDNFAVFSLLCLLLTTASCTKEKEPTDEPIKSFRFTASADNRDLHQTWRYVVGQINKVCGDEGAFHLSAGDVDPIDSTFAIMKEVFGEDVLFYLCIGNHELPGVSSTSNDRPDENMPWLRNHFSTLPNIVNDGPSNCKETTYSYDYGPAHFVLLNQYYNGKSDIALDGDVSDSLYAWLEADLALNSKKIIIVVGHEPAFPEAVDHHALDCINKYSARRDRFWNLLKEYHVAAHLTSHTHRYLMSEIQGVLEINLGTAGQTNDWLVDDPKKLTFLDVLVNETSVKFKAYSGKIGTDFTLEEEREFVLKAE
jgi:3',5'-cyclic AMP phosphodiesterase CpdA